MAGRLELVDGEKWIDSNSTVLPPPAQLPRQCLQVELTRGVDSVGVTGSEIGSRVGSEIGSRIGSDKVIGTGAGIGEGQPLTCSASERERERQRDGTLSDRSSAVISANRIGDNFGSTDSAGFSALSPRHLGIIDPFGSICPVFEERQNTSSTGLDSNKAPFDPFGIFDTVDPFSVSKSDNHSNAHFSRLDGSCTSDSGSGSGGGGGGGNIINNSCSREATNELAAFTLTSASVVRTSLSSTPTTVTLTQKSCQTHDPPQPCSISSPTPALGSLDHPARTSIHSGSPHQPPFKPIAMDPFSSSHSPRPRPPPRPPARLPPHVSTCTG